MQAPSLPELMVNAYDSSFQKVCRDCKRLFLNRRVFNKHRELGKCLSAIDLSKAGLWSVPTKPLRTSSGVLHHLWVDTVNRTSRQPSYDPADFDPQGDYPLNEPKRCHKCERLFRNRWVFLRHRPEGRNAIDEPADPTIACYSDRQLERLGFYRIAVQHEGKDAELWADRGDVSPLDEVPGAERQGHGKGRTFPEGHRYSAHYQAEQRRKRNRGSLD